MDLIPKATSRNPVKGTWRQAVVNGENTATLFCPACGQESSLDRHAINTTGVVLPMFECPNQKCQYEAPITLENWEGD